MRVYTPKPRNDAYLRLNFNISKLVYYRLKAFPNYTERNTGMKLSYQDGEGVLLSCC